VNARADFLNNRDRTKTSLFQRVSPIKSMAASQSFASKTTMATPKLNNGKMTSDKQSFISNQTITKRKSIGSFTFQDTIKTGVANGIGSLTLN